MDSGSSLIRLLFMKKNIIPVSVVIPCYCCSDTIDKAVDSVISQTVLPCELILIDDGSEDNGKTKTVIERIRESNVIFEKINCTLIFLEKNSGPSGARNAGWDCADGDYIAFLDADDSWHPEKLRIQYDYMKSHPEITLSGHKSVYSKSRSHLHPVTNSFDIRVVSKFSMFISNRLPTRSVMLKRDIPYRFLFSKRNAEDYLLWLLIILNNHLISYIDLELAYSYKRDYGDGGLTNSLYECHRGVVDTFRKILEAKKISYPLFLVLLCFSYFKHFNRVFIFYFLKIRDFFSIRI